MEARPTSKKSRNPDPGERDREPQELQDEDIDESNPTRHRTTNGDAEDLQDEDLDEGGSR